jgi:hypothetical protein
MKCLDETPEQVANRMRELAAGIANPADAQAIRRYADWLERNPDADELQETGSSTS